MQVFLWVGKRPWQLLFLFAIATACWHLYTGGTPVPQYETTTRSPTTVRQQEAQQGAMGPEVKVKIKVTAGQMAHPQTLMHSDLMNHGAHELVNNQVLINRSSPHGVPGVHLPGEVPLRKLSPQPDMPIGPQGMRQNPRDRSQKSLMGKTAVAMDSNGVPSNQIPINVSSVEAK